MARTSSPQRRSPSRSRPGDGARRIAAVDIGSNSIRQVVADVSPDGTIRVVDEMKAMPRLGAGVVATGSLTADSMDRAIEALTRMAELSKQLGAQRVEAVATSAVRDAANGPAFLERVRRETGLVARLIDGTRKLVSIQEITGMEGEVADELLALGPQEFQTRLQAACHEPYFVPENTPLSTQLINFQKQKRRIGIVALVVVLIFAGKSFFAKKPASFGDTAKLDIQDFLQNGNSLRGNEYVVEGKVDERLRWTSASGQVVSVHVIPRPHANLEDVLPIGKAAKG